MGQQQILLIVLSVILVAIAVSVGITMFRGYSQSANQDAMVMDIINIANLAFQYRVRPIILGGSMDASFDGFEDYYETIPSGMKSNANGTYTVSVTEVGGSSQLTIVGESKMYEGATITATYDSSINLIGPMEMEGWEE